MKIVAKIKSFPNFSNLLFVGRLGIWDGIFISVFVSVVSFLFFPSLSFGLKIGYIDLQKVIQEADAAKDAKRRIDNEFRLKQQELQKAQSELIKYQDEILKKSKFMDEKQLDEKRKEYESKQEEFFRKVKEYEAQIQMLDAELSKKVIEDIKSIIKQIAEKEGYDIILEINQIFYVKDADDLTFKLIDLYNKEYKKKKGSEKGTIQDPQEKIKREKRK